MNKSYNKLIILTLSLVLVLGVVTGCGSKDKQEATKQQEAENNGVPVEVVRTKTGEIANYITVTGTAKAVKSANLTPQLQETVEEVLVDEGDQVKANEQLIQLDQEDIRAKVAEARAGLEASQAGLEELLSGTREEEIDRLTAQVEQAKANYQQAKRDYERYQKLFDKEAISKQQLESTKTKYLSAKNNYQALQESLKMAKAGPTAEQIKTQRAKFKQAEAALNTAKLNLAKTKIRAPFNGIVADVSVEEGEMVGAQPVISVVDLSTIKLKTYVSEKNINKLEINQPVEVEFNALEDKLSGKIKNINPTLNQKEQGFPIEIKVKNHSKFIKSGMYAEITIETQRSANNIVIPKHSLLRENGSSYVFIVKDNKAVKKEVKTGLTTFEQVEILAGIKQGDQLITSGAEQVTDGNSVRVVGGGE